MFHLDGELIRDFKRSWATVCRKAGVSKVLVHDLRRTAVRNMVRAGIPDRIAMPSRGTRPEACSTATNIVSESDLAEATERLEVHFNSRMSEPRITPRRRLINDRFFFSIWVVLRHSYPPQ